jgi:uncharacterized membrane protein YgdD (TMEM256/DUF423 family)
MRFPLRRWLVVGGLGMALAVALAAWHAHGLRSRLPDAAHQAFGRALHQHELAALGWMLLGLLEGRVRPWLGHLAGGVLLLGALLFCGSVYAATAGGLEGATRLAPMGGVFLMAGWLLVGLAGWWRPDHPVG